MSRRAEVGIRRGRPLAGASRRCVMSKNRTEEIRLTWGGKTDPPEKIKEYVRHWLDETTRNMGRDLFDEAANDALSAYVYLRELARAHERGVDHV
jgi:hypothetical protein